MRRPDFALPQKLACRLVAALVLLLLTAPGAWAIDSARTAVTLVQQAAKSYEAGDFVKAADLYQKAWRLDPSPAYLWALARSEHLAGLNESAIEHYRQFIANPGAESARVGKAQAYLAEVELEVNKTRLREADAATRSGNPALAAELYLQAYKTAPGRVDWLFKTAVAEQMAENFQASLQHFDQYLALAPLGADERGQAVAREAFLRQKLGLAPLKVIEKTVVQPAGTTQPEPDKQLAPDRVGTPVVNQPAETTRPMWPGWVAIGGGVAALAGGALLLADAQSQAAQLTKDQNHDSGQLITTMSRETALSRASAINNRAAIGWTLAGVGVAASGFGIWWLARHPQQTAIILPTANGAQLAVRF
jgi:tetratricopeptide (TPR) repeat protein